MDIFAKAAASRTVSGHRAVLLGCASLLAIGLSQQAYAQTAPANLASPPLNQAPLYLEAQTLTRESETGPIKASGQVQAVQGGRTVLADEITYDPATGAASAVGNVRMQQPDGSVLTSDSLSLDRDMTAGRASDVILNLAEGGRIEAGELIRLNATTDEMSNARFTVCPVCVGDDLEDAAPPWAIRAAKVRRDQASQTVTYEDAVLELYGYPVAALPVFWHPDPSVDRKSGLLAPDFTLSRRRGLSYRQPWLQVISKSEDIVITPQINTRVRPFVEAAWRRRFYTGDVNARIGFTHERDLNGDGERIGEETFRSFILSEGRFDLARDWQMGFSLERASEDLVFEKYDTDDVTRQRGLIATEQGRLVSQLYALRQTDSLYFSASLVSVQGLRPTDNDRTFPSIAPMIEGLWTPRARVLGGRLRLGASAVLLQRDQSPDDAALSGIDSRRASLDLDWRRTSTLDNGIQVSPFLFARSSLYRLADQVSGADDTVSDSNAIAGVDLSYPMIRQDGAGTYLLEPLVQIAISPEGDLDLDIPNEDSGNLEFDDTTLFRADKFDGYDRHESGFRANLGARLTFNPVSGGAYSVMIGRSFRDQVDQAFSSRSGLREETSDWVVAATASPIEGLSLFSRARFEGAGQGLRRLETGADIETPRIAGFIRYLHDNADRNGIRRQDLDFAGEFQITRRWAMSVHGVADLEDGVWRRQEIGLIRTEDCLRFEVVYQHSETFNRTLGPSDSLKLRLTLATLGDTGYSLRRRYQ